MRGKQIGCTLEKQDIRVGWERSTQNTYHKDTGINYSILLISNCARSANWLLVTIIEPHLLQQERRSCMGKQLLETLAHACAASERTKPRVKRLP